MIAGYPFKKYLILAAATLAANTILGCDPVPRSGKKESPDKLLTYKVDALEARLDTLEKELSTLKQQGEKDTGPAAISEVSVDISAVAADDPFIGKPDSPVVMMTFCSFESNLCRKLLRETLPVLRERFVSTGRLQFVLRDFPLPTHKLGEKAAEIAHCAGEKGKYWEAFTALLTELSDEKLNRISRSIPDVTAETLEQCVKSARYTKEIAADLDDGRMMGVQGIPATFIFKRAPKPPYDAKLVRGAQPTRVFIEEIARLLPSEK